MEHNQLNWRTFYVDIAFVFFLLLADIKLTLDTIENLKRRRGHDNIHSSKSRIKMALVRFACSKKSRSTRMSESACVCASNAYGAKCLPLSLSTVFVAI